MSKDWGRHQSEIPKIREGTYLTLYPSPLRVWKTKLNSIPGKNRDHQIKIVFFLQSISATEGGPNNSLGQVSLGLLQ